MKIILNHKIALIFWMAAIGRRAVKIDVEKRIIFETDTRAGSVSERLIKTDSSTDFTYS